MLADYSQAFAVQRRSINEVSAVDDAAFKRKSEVYFGARHKQTTLLVVSHNLNTIKRFCSKMLVLYKGKLHEFENTDLAEDFYREVCCARPHATPGTVPTIEDCNYGNE